MRGSERWLALGVCLVWGLACGQRGDSTSPKPATVTDKNPVRSRCLEGCARVHSCAAEVELDDAAVGSCETKCKRLRSSATADTGPLDRCLERPTCVGYADCLRGEAPPSGPIAVPDPGIRGCEPLCGQVGDCLVGLGDEVPLAAAKIETSCLEVCLRKSENKGLDAPILACGDQRYCSDLISCVSDAWSTSPAQPADAEVAVPAGPNAGCDTLCNVMTQCADGAQVSRDQCEQMCEPFFAMFDSEGVNACLNRGSCDEMGECLSKLPTDGFNPPGSAGAGPPKP